MPSYRIISQCAGGDHLQVEVSGDDGKAQVVPMLLSELVSIKQTTPVEDLRRIVLGKPLADVVSDLVKGVSDVQAVAVDAEVKP